MTHTPIRTVGAYPADAGDLLPVGLDSALGATEARKAWEAACAGLTAASRTLSAARREWRDTHKPREYADNYAMLAARMVDLGDLEDAVAKAERDAKRALLAYDRKQREGYAAARGDFASKWLAADARALEALEILDAALIEREALARFVARPEASAIPGTGHWSRSLTLAGNLDPSASYFRTAIRIVTETAPRTLVKAQATAAAAKAVTK